MRSPARPPAPKRHDALQNGTAGDGGRYVRLATARQGGLVGPPLPEGTPSRFDWDRMSGYWIRKDDKNELLFFSREGMLNSSKEIDGSFLYFIGRWQVVQELKPARPDVHAVLVMATDEKFCNQTSGKQTPHFRLLEYGLDYYEKNQLRNDYSLDVFPPPDLQLPANRLWSHFL
ncbi:MAG: hypothetical protein HQL45_17780, partial [Alphaproteobacteria bacterium]|nr:hypothetical protein [Alphaproteobacteria bacterium]